ncbi:hypothetical protein [Demequina aurantiaca]|uniref:hypothetical protein n=1 Tax=Demequina aurantiaca TaxID=676200 RepID=UPI003D3280F1
MIIRLRLGLTSATGAIVLAASLAGCSISDGASAEEAPGIAASCAPMTVEASPSPATAGESVTLQFENIHAMCNDTGSTTYPPEPASASIGLLAINGDWRADDLAVADKDEDWSGTAEFMVPADAPAGKMKVMAFGREIGQIDVVAP